MPASPSFPCKSAKPTFNPVKSCKSCLKQTTCPGYSQFRDLELLIWSKPERIVVLE